MRWTFILGIILIIIGIILISIPFISNAIKENSINQTNRNVFISIGVISFVIGIISIIIGFYTKRLGSNKSKPTIPTPTPTPTPKLDPEEKELNNNFNIDLKSKYNFNDFQLKFIYDNFDNNELMALFYLSNVKDNEIPDFKIIIKNIKDFKYNYRNFIQDSLFNLIFKLELLKNAFNSYNIILNLGETNLFKKIDDRINLLEEKYKNEEILR